MCFNADRNSSAERDCELWECYRERSGVIVAFGLLSKVYRCVMILHVTVYNWFPFLIALNYLLSYSLTRPSTPLLPK